MRKNKNIIIALVIIILIVAGIVALLYTRTDLFKSDEDLFYKYLLSTEFVNKEVSQRYTKVVNRIQASNFSANGTVYCSMSANDTTTNISNIQNLFAIKYNLLANKNLKQNYADFTISSNNKDITTLRYLRDDNIYALKADNVVDKYLALENKELKSFCAKLGIEDTSKIPNQIQTNTTQKLLDIDKEQLNTIKSTYTKILTDKLTKDNFTKITNTDKTKTIELSLTQKQLADIKKALLENLKNDTNTLNLIIEKAEILDYDLNVDSLKTSIQEKMDEITNTEKSETPGFFKLAVRIKDNKTVAINLITTQIEEGNQTQETINIDLSESNKLIIYINDGKQNIKEDISFGYEDNKILCNAETLELDKNNNVKSSMAKIQYEIINYETDNMTQNMLITLNSSAANQKIQINMDNKIQLRQDVQIEKITDKNATILNNQTQEEISNLIYKIVLRVQYLYGDVLKNINN